MNIYKTLTVLILISVFAISSLAVSSENVSGHSPSGMELEYDVENGQLNITITHNVEDKSTHYIEKINIKKNGNDVDTLNYNSQPSTSTFTYNYQVNAEAGDNINVKASCSQGGNIEKTIKITEEGAKSTENGTPFPRFPAVAASMFLLAVILNLKQR